MKVYDRGREAQKFKLDCLISRLYFYFEKQQGFHYFNDYATLPSRSPFLDFPLFSIIEIF